MKSQKYTKRDLENSTMTKFIPIHQYCALHGVSRQNVYRWIREGKFPKQSVKKIEKTVQRIYVDSGAMVGRPTKKR